MKHYYKLIAVTLFVSLLHLSCKDITTGQASASMIIAKEGPSHINAAAEHDISNTATGGKTVWICQSAASKRYHLDASCRGLKRCTHTILKTTVDRAKALGLTMCGFEK